MNINKNKQPKQEPKLIGTKTRKSEHDYIEEIDDLIFNSCLDEALKLVVKCKFLFPVSDSISKREAEIYFEQEEYDRAFTIYDLLKNENDNSKRDLCLAVKLMNKEFLDEAKSLTTKLTSSKESNISSRAYAILADIYFLKKDYKSMYRWSREALKRNAFIESLVDKFYLSIVLTNNYSKSIPFFESLLDENPYSAKIWLYTGQTYLAMGYNKQAIESFEMALFNDETLVEAKNLILANQNSI